MGSECSDGLSWQRTCDLGLLLDILAAEQEGQESGGAGKSWYL